MDVKIAFVGCRRPPQSQSRVPEWARMIETFLLTLNLSQPSEARNWKPPRWPPQTAWPNSSEQAQFKA